MPPIPVLHRPSRGQEDFYLRRLVTCGLGVAFTASVLALFCEAYARNEKRIFSRAVRIVPGYSPDTSFGCGWEGEEPPPLKWSEVRWPAAIYSHADWPDGSIVQFGAFLPYRHPAPHIARPAHLQPGTPVVAPRQIHVDLKPAGMDRLLQGVQPPLLVLDPLVPLKKKKPSQPPGLRRWGA